MTDAADLLARLHAAGVAVRAVDGRLLCKPTPPADLLAEVRRHKAGLLALLAGARIAEVVPVGALALWVYDRLYPPGPGDPPAVPPPADLSPEQIAAALADARRQQDRYRRWWQAHPPAPGRPTLGPLRALASDEEDEHA